jgi:glycosyltransferase involved in cell wall biosynthesis
MPQISYIVTVYNKAEFLPAVAGALKNQKGLGEVEAIFVDDGSTDNSPEVLQAIVDDWPAARVIRQENSGPAPATNAGIFAARGQWIKIMDGDDVLHEDATRALVDAAEKFDTRFAYGKITQVPWQAGGPVVSSATPSPREAAPEHDLRPLVKFSEKMTSNPSCVLINTEFAQAIGGVDTRIFAQDYSLYLRAAHRTPFAFVPADIGWAPGAGLAAGRVSDDEAQILHDLNAALACFIDETPDLDPAIRRRMLARGTGRAWKWANRQAGQSMLSPYFLMYVLSRLPTSRMQAINRLFRSRDIFRQTNPIRIPNRVDGRDSYETIPPGKPVRTFGR